MGKMKIDFDLLQFIRDNLNAGETPENIASLVGCSIKEIEDIQKKFDIYNKRPDGCIPTERYLYQILFFLHIILGRIMHFLK